MKRIIRFSLPFFVAVALAVAPMAANSQGKPSLLVLGSAHFYNPGRDNIKLAEVEDMLADQRQKELESVVNQLAGYRPTHIAVEIPSERQSALDERYQAYRAGKYELGRTEADQLGLRLAAKLGHKRIYAVDWNGNPPGNEADYDWYAYGQLNGFKDAVAAITDPENAKKYYVELKEQSVGHWLKQLNTPEALQASHKSYFDIAMIGKGKELPGANWVGTWYARNLKIFSQLVKLATQPDDRILVIYGQGHAYLLQQFAQESGAFQLVRVEDVLKEQ